MKAPKHSPDIPEHVLKRWWWRRLVFVKFEEQTHTTQRRLHVPEYPKYGFSGEWRLWHHKDEVTAFRYELLQRTCFPDLPDWLSLPTWLFGWVLGILAPKPDRAIRAIFAPSAPPNYASLEDWMWDLTASDEALCRSFLSLVNQERNKLGLAATNDPFKEFTGKVQKHQDKRRGMRSRSVSWLAVESHDLKSYGIRPLNDAERSRLSKARREIGVFETPLREAIEHAKRNTSAEYRNADMANIYRRFLRENFTDQLTSQSPAA